MVLKNPSIIQQKAVLLIIRRLVLITQAQSGTGKTSAFATEILQFVVPEKDKIQCLILSTSILRRYLYIKVSLLIEETRVSADVDKLKEGP